MRNLKRVLSVLLVFVLFLGMFPVLPAQAEAPYEGNKKGTITFTVRDSLSNTPLAGALVMLEDLTAGREHNHGTQMTAANGQVSWTGLSSGWYRVTETSVPDGYVLNSEPNVFYFDTENQAVYKDEIRNRSESALHIYRIDPGTSKGLANAGYVVYDSDGHSVAQGVTNEDGYFIVPHLPAGEYTVQEVSAPAGFNIAAQPQTIRIVEHNDEPYAAIFSGAEKSTITILNYDGKDGSPIQGSRWRVSRAGGGTVNGNLVTNAAGLAIVTDLEPGDYIVEELQAAAGYVNQLKHANVTIGSKTEHAVVSLSNIKPGSVTIYVGDSVTGKDLEGCQFTLYDTNGHIIAGPALSNANGYVTFEGVEDGNYTVTAQPRKGYVMDNTSMSLNLTNGGDRSVTFSATPLGTLVIKAISSTDNSSPVAGCTFEVRKMDGTLIGEYDTDSTGSIQITGLDTGYFVVKELRAPEGYVIETSSKTTYVEAGTANTVVFTHRDRPFVVVQCYISGTTTPIPGSRIRLYNDKGIAVRDGTIGSDGSFTFTNLDPGTYRVEYVSAPDGYTIDTFEQMVEVSTVKGALAILYADRHSSIIIHKVDADSKALLPGASFIIRDAKGVIQEIVTTDGSGSAVTKVLDPGQYTIHEQFAPNGYVPTTNTQTIAVRNNETSIATFSNKKDSAIVVYAYDTNGNPMANVSYILYDVITGQELSTKNTDTAGIAIFEQLKPGSYMVTQDTIPEGYVLTTPTQARILLNAGEPTYVRFNHVAKATIKMETVDSADGKAIFGAVYQIMNETGSFVANYATDTNGEAESISLEPGTYYVKQIVAPDGCLLNTTTQTVTVQRSRVNLAKFYNRAISHIVVECVESGENFGLTGATITIEDEAGKEAARGTTTEGGIFTSDDLTPGRYTVKVIASPNGYTCIQRQRTIEVTTGKASTVKFEFTSNNHIIVNLTDASDPTKGLEGSTFRIESVDGDFEIDIRTDKAGHAESPALPDGRYMVHQTAAPDGYILDQSYQWATVTASGDTVLDFTNRRISALTIQALTEKTHAGLVGTFEVWEQNGKLIKTVTTDETGIATIENLASGIYVVREVAVPEGYTARTLTQTVTINFETPSTLNFYHTVNSALTVKKVDADTNKPLAEAEFRITKSNGDFVGDYTTDSAGLITIATLPAGTYNIAETKEPQGYVKDTTSRSFEIRDDQAVVLTIPNHKQSELTIRALVEKGREPLAGAEFEILSAANLVVKTVVSDKTGVILVSGLNPGTYTVRETKVPNGYTARTITQTVTISYESPSTLDYFHTAESILTVNKKDAATGDMLQGASFRLTKANGDFVGDYTTNEFGQFVVDTLPAGDYVLTELRAPNGYVAITTPKTFSIKDDQPVVIDITNDKQVDLVIRSLTEAERDPLAETTFEVYTQDGNLVCTVTTDASGSVTVSGLNPATYTVKESKVPAGYTALTLTQSITINTKTPATLDFLHTQKSTLTINKIDADTNAPLAGAKFRITKANGDFFGDYTTNEAGQIVISSVPAGTYNVSETQAPEGYIADTTSRSFTIKDNQSAVLDIPNHKLTGLTIRALTEADHKGLTGAEFEVMHEGKLVKTVISGEDGTVTIDGLNPGVYTVTETVVPTGYTARILTQTVTIGTEYGRLDFYHTAKSTLTIVKKDGVTGDLLSGAEFRITTSKGDLVGNYTTNESGQIIVDEMEAGTYNIAEVKAPKGYTLDTASKSFTMEDNRPLTLEFVNYQQTDLTIRALTEADREGLAGAQYDICKEDGTIVKTVTTLTDGTIVVVDLAPGTYVVKETRVPDGYTVRQAIQTVTIRNEVSATLDFFHTMKSTLTIVKKDGVTGDPLFGAEFRITTSKGDLVGTYTTDKSGQIVIDSMKAGTYNIVEVKAPEGYTLDTASKSFSIDDNRPLTLELVNYQMTDLTIRALTDPDRKGLSGAQYDICLEDGTVVTTVTTMADGTIAAANLVPGTYIVKETIVPDGYTVRQAIQKITITNKVSMTLDFFHTMKSTLTIVKKDGVTGEVLAGAEYRITTSKGDLVGTYTTDKSGEIVIDSLEAGTYNIAEIKAPEGYIADSASKSFTIEDNRPLMLELINYQKTDLTIRALTEAELKGLEGAQYDICKEDGTVVKTVSTQVDGTIVVADLTPGTYVVKETKVPNGYTVRLAIQTVTITNKVSQTLDFYHSTKSTLTITKTDGVTDAPLAGAEYRITTSKGDLVGTYTTDKSGRIVIDSMEAGTYNIVETKAPDGYTLDSASKSFTIEDNHSISLDFVNYQKTDLTINALVEADRKGLAGAQYDICMEDGTVVKTVTTLADGSIVVVDLAPGNYIVKEVKVPDGYTVRQAVQTITITNKVSAVLNFYHTTQSTVTIVKTDSKTNAPLAGAHFRITRANGEVVGDYVTNASGRIVIATMPAGIYNISETKAPDGYILDTTSKSFEVKDDKATLIELTNTAVGTFRIVDTCKQDGKPIPGIVFRINTYDGELIGTYTTDAGGIINVNLAPGKYTVYQVSVPEGYVRLEDAWNITITEGKDNLLEVKNERLTKIVVHMIDASSKMGLYGVELSIKDIKNNVVGTYRTDNEGNINLTGILDAGKYILSLKTVPNNYNKDEVPKTIEVKIGETTEVTWALQGHKGQVTIVTYAGEDNATMNIRKNTLIGGAIYQITTPNGQVVGTIQGDLNGAAYSGALAVGTYYFQQIVAPVGWQVNSSKFAVNVSSTNDNIRVEVYNKAANYATDISVSGTASAMPGGNVKYNFNVANNSTSAMANFFIHMKVPTDGMRAVTLYTGTYSGSATTYYVEYKTNMNGYRMLAQNLNSQSSYSYGLSTQALGLQTGEYVTDIRMVFTSVVAGMKTATAASLNCYVLSTVPNGYQGIMRAECGALVGYYSNASSGGQWGNAVGQSILSNPAVTTDNGWVTSSGQYITYVAAPTPAPVYQNPLPSKLPTTGY